MRYGHVTSGGRYPVLRALAILYMVSAAGLFIYGLWQALTTLITARDSVEGKVVTAIWWMAGGFLAALLAIGISEVIKLFMDIEHNTRIAALRAAHGAAMEATPGSSAASDNGVETHDGPGLPVVGAREKKWLDGAETAEGALLRGH